MIRAELMAQSGEKGGLLPSRFAPSLICTVAPACRCGLARFIMTAALLRRLCQQFEMGLVLHACDRCELSPVRITAN